MKFFTKLLTAFLFLIILSADTKAQTTLSQGDISIVGFTSNVNQSNTGFCFVSYVNLSAGTVIKFTCNDMTAAAASSTASSAWNTNTNQTLYWTASSAVSAGTVVSITSTSSFSALAASTGSITYGTSGNGGNGTSFGMVNSGRNVFVFQYGSTNDFDASSSSTATFNGSGLIFGLVYAGGLGSSTYLASGTGSAFKGYQPTDLSSSYTVTGLGATVRYSAYSGSTSGFASLAAAKSAINNAGNWTSGTTTTGAATFPGNFTFPSSNTAPTFTNSTPQTLTVCQNASATSINTLLTVSDADASQTETWSVTTAPTHGTLGGFNATASSGSTSITPTGLTYTPTNGYSGSDQFIIQVSDGTATASMTVNVTVNALPTITLGSVSSVNTSATSFSLPYSATTGSPDQYSIVTGSPTAMSSFSAVSNATLGSSPISVTIPASTANTYNFNATVKNTTTGCVSAAVPFTLTVSTPTPTVNTTGSLSSFSSCSGAASSSQSFSVSGSNLTANLVVTPPSGFEVSITSGSGYASSVSLTPASGTVSSTTIYARLTNSASGTPNGNITAASTGATTQNVAASGTVNALPTITLGSVSSVNTSATSFSLPYSATTGSPDQYSIVTGSPTAMSSFSAVSNATLGSSPISVTIPASAANTYNFNATVTNSTTGCISASNAFTVLVFGAPTTQATNVSYSSTTTTQTGISWTNGNGSSRAVFVAAASSGTPSAVTNTTYTANTVFGSGTQISSSGWYCVYNGTGTSVTVTGLTAGTIYRTMVVEYNGSAGTEVYYTSTATGNPANITMPTSTTWNGTSWSNGNPSSTIDAIVSDVSNTAPASFSCKNLTINSGAALNCTGITATINGNITNSGNGISGTGTLTIAATCAVTGNFFIFSGIINLSSGTFTTGGRITIAPGGAITGTYSNLSGSVALQQSIIAQRGWRMFAHPFTTAQTFASIAGANNVTINTSAGPAGIADTRVFNNSSNAWVDAGTSPTANTAYGLFIRGITTDIQGGGTGLTYAAGPTAFTYTVAGTLNTGNYTVPAPSNTSNFTLVGNPFAAPVNSSELTNGTGVSYYVYQISVSGDGRTKAGAWSTVLSSSATTPIPVLGVIAWKPSSSYTIHTSGINTSDAAATGLFGIETPIPHIELQIEQNGNQQDNFFVRLDPAATANGTDKTDLDKFYNDNVNVYSITDDKNRLGVDARNVLDKIPLGISALAGDYNFKLADNNLPTGTTVYLNDKYLNTQTALKVGDTYPFTISSDASTMGEQRFELSFSIKSTAAANDPPRSLTANVLGNITSGNLIAVQIGGATTPVTIAVKDMNGKALGTMSAANGIQYVNVGNTAKGMLLLQISDGKSSIIKKVMKL